jgi:hypothetical protein
MSSEVAIPDDKRAARFEQSLAAEQAAEQGMWVTIAKSILLALPITIGIFVLMTAIAISADTDWFVWLGLGVGLGVLGACLLGSLAGATIAAHRLDAVDRATYDL